MVTVCPTVASLVEEEIVAVRSAAVTKKDTDSVITRTQTITMAKCFLILISL